MIARLAQLAREVAAVTRRVLGIPDYERYLAHLHRAHPGATPLSREAFLRSRLDDRYSRPGARCC